MPVLTMKETPRPTSTTMEQKLEEQIRSHAYELYESRGREDSHDLEDSLPADTTGNATPGAAA